MVSYDSNTGEWVILRGQTLNGEFNPKRLTVICDFSKTGNHEAVHGADACGLTVGRLMVDTELDYLNGKTKDFVQILEMSSDWIVFTEGVGERRTDQHFKIVKQELLKDSLHR